MDPPLPQNQQEMDEQEVNKIPINNQKYRWKLSTSQSQYKYFYKVICNVILEDSICFDSKIYNNITQHKANR